MKWKQKRKMRELKEVVRKAVKRKMGKRKEERGKYEELERSYYTEWPFFLHDHLP